MWLEIGLGVWAGFATVVAGVVSRQPRTKQLRVGGSSDGRFGGFTVTVKEIKGTSMTLERDGADAVRVRIVDGRAAVEWDDGRFTDVMELTRRHLWRHGPPGAVSIR